MKPKSIKGKFTRVLFAHKCTIEQMRVNLIFSFVLHYIYQNAQEKAHTNYLK